jgi:7-carboxy-7-deazaguanine synthase
MSLNTQPVEKQFLSPIGQVEVHSMFLTLQGEGPFAGHRSVFVRLAGCNLMCPGCDTEYTGKRERMTPTEVVDAINIMCEDSMIDWDANPLVVITGGEPFRQNLGPLCQELADEGFRVQIESNGVFEACEQVKHLTRMGFVGIVISPKTSRIHPSWGEYAMAFKYVLACGAQNPVDGLPTRALEHKATPHVARPPTGYKGPVYVNPADEKDPELNQQNAELVAYTALHFGYIAGVQMHKIFNLE